MLTGGLYYDLEAEMFSPQMCRCQGEFGMFPLFKPSLQLGPNKDI